MAATTTLLGLVTPTQGTLSGTWGDTVNYGISDYVDIAVAGTLTLTGDGAVTLANTTGSSSGSNITSTLAGAGTVTAQFSTVRVSGTTTTKVVTGPSYSKSYLVDNASSFAVTFKASGQTGVSISPSEKVYVYYNATDYVKVGGGGITYGAVKTTTYTAVANDGVLTNTTSAAFTVNLPATPSTGTQVFIADSAGTWATNNLTIGRNGSTIAGSATDLVCDINSVSIQCVYNGTTWDIFAQIGANDTAVVTLNGTQTLTNKTLTSPTITSPTVTGTGTIAAATVTLSSTLSVTGVSTLTAGAVVQGLTVGRGAGAVASNTVVGAGSLNGGSQTGTFNTVIGYQAATANTTGNSFVAIGPSAFAANTTGADGVAIGSGALSANTTGSTNHAVGRVALLSNTTGSNNSAFGGGALQNNTTASNNTAVGYQAGYSNTTNGANAFFGGLSGYSNTGVTNTYIGYGAGYSMTSGGKNAIIGGYNGNQDGLDIRTASNYAVISDGDGNRLLSTANGYSLALDGGAVPQTGTGITFPATQSASSDANTLDDYEEGTWTPSLGGTTTYYTQTGQYTKIGNLVFIKGVLVINSIGTGSTTVISGLPFTNTAGIVGVSVGSFFQSATSIVSFFAQIASNGATIAAFSLTAAGTTEAINAIFQNNTQFQFSACYRV